MLEALLCCQLCQINARRRMHAMHANSVDATATGSNTRGKTSKSLICRGRMQCRSVASCAVTTQIASSGRMVPSNLAQTADRATRLDLSSLWLDVHADQTSSKCHLMKEAGTGEMGATGFTSGDVQGQASAPGGYALIVLYSLQIS